MGDNNCMYFNSMQYLIFFVLVLTVYYLLPKRVRYLWLLASSYYFYMNWSAKYTLLILGVTAITYFAALFIGANEGRVILKKIILLITLIMCFGLLIYFKYSNFIIGNINRLISNAGLNYSFSSLKILLPVGISFYIFQALSYVIDVYRNDIDAEKNPFRYALFISFFPQLVAGPIERSKNILDQLSKPKRLTGERLREGLIYILIGIWYKVLVADNIAKIINPIFNKYQLYSGSAIAIATMLFGIQIYCDFGGYSTIAIGSAKLFGIDLMNNFFSPYLARSVPDFWKRWHISLTSWFRDYLYIPLGGNRKGIIRKYINTLIVFFVSGIWHGASWNFIFWGTLNGFMLIASNVKQQLICQKKEPSRVDIIGMRIFTFLLVDFTWLFFRAPSLRTSISIIKHSFIHPGLRSIFTGSILKSFGNTQNLFIILVSIVIMFLIDAVKDKTGNFITYLSNQRVFYRWFFYLLLILMIIIYGAYGEGYEQTEFIYFQF